MGALWELFGSSSQLRVWSHWGVPWLTWNIDELFFARCTSWLWSRLPWTCWPSSRSGTRRSCWWLLRGYLDLSTATLVPYSLGMVQCSWYRNTFSPLLWKACFSHVNKFVPCLFVVWIDSVCSALWVHFYLCHRDFVTVQKEDLLSSDQENSCPT